MIESAKTVHKIPKNPGKGCSDLFHAFASEGLISEVDSEDVKYHKRRSEWFERNRKKKQRKKNS